MICKEVQKQMKEFVNDELEMNQLKKFLEHIEKCESCRENLEVYYTLFSGMKILDSDKEIASDFDIDFEKMIKRAEENIRAKRMRKIQKKIIALFLVFLVAFFL